MQVKTVAWNDCCERGRESAEKTHTKGKAACPQAGDPISIHCGPLLLWVGG